MFFFLKMANGEKITLLHLRNWTQKTFKKNQQKLIFKICSLLKSLNSHSLCKKFISYFFAKSLQKYCFFLYFFSMSNTRQVQPKTKKNEGQGPSVFFFHVVLQAMYRITDTFFFMVLWCLSI